MLRFTRIARLALLALAPAALAVAAPAPAAPNAAAAHIEVRVLPHAEVHGATFTLGEVAELDGADLNAVRHVAGTSLGRSPLPGRSLRLNEPFIRARLMQVPGGDHVQLLVPPDAEVTRASQVIRGSEIGAKVLAAAADDAAGIDGEVQQELAAPLADAVLPTGEVNWDIKPLGVNLSAGGTRTFRVAARLHGEEVWQALARVRQQVSRDVVVAARAIRRNQVIRAADVTVEHRPVNGMKDAAYLTHTKDAIGGRAKRPIGRGEWLKKDLLLAVADVPEGSPVLLVYQTAVVRFTSPGVALVPGKVGDFVPVRNLDSGKIVYGVVQKDESVKVN